MRILVRPVIDPQREIDLTHRLTAAIAEELWRLYGGNDQLNWLEAELHLQRIVGEARAEARDTEVLVVGTEGRGQQDGTTTRPALSPANAAARLLRSEPAILGLNRREVITDPGRRSGRRARRRASSPA